MTQKKKPVSLILGANGYLGRHMVKELHEHGHRIIPSDMHKNSTDQVPQYICASLLDPELLHRAIKQADYIYIFAGKTGTSDGFEKYADYISINELGLLHLLSEYKKCKAHARIIFPSSRLVYKGKKNAALVESDSNAFLSVYALTKFSGERYLELFNKVYGIPYTIFRICVPYGNSIDTTLSYGTINHFVTQAQHGDTITLYGSGSQKRTLTHIDDLTAILRKGSQHRKTLNGIFNVGGPDHLSIQSIATVIANIYDVKVDSVPWPSMAKKTESGDTIFDSKKLDSIIKHRYQHTFGNWAKEYLN